MKQLRAPASTPMHPRHNVVIDTGVLISAFVFGGAPAKAVLKVFHEANIHVSRPLLKEYRATPITLHKSGKINHEQYQALIAGIAAFVARAVLVVTRKHFHLCRDVKDDMVLDCCYAANADILITGDKDLLSLGDLPFKLHILTVRDYLAD